MNVTVNIHSLGIDQLSVAEKLDLIEQIWDSLPEQVGADEVPDWHVAELEKRLANALKQPEAGKPWQEFLEELEAGS